MVKGVHILMLLVGCMLLLVGCKPKNEPEKEARLPLSVCLQADAVSGARAPRRALGDPGQHPSRAELLGDPGTTEQFLLPRYVWFFVLKQEGGNWVIWHADKKEVSASDWVRESYNGQLESESDIVYRYTHEVLLMLGNERFNGRVYAIASYEDLTFNTEWDEVDDLDELLALTFDASSADVQRNLQHIYTTPYNYNVSGSYYGSFSSIQEKVPSVRLLLYHIAAKVDLQWSVAADKRIDKDVPANGIRLTYMEARRLFNGNAHCFQPLRNTVAALPESGYDITDIVTADDEGLWWEGRSYFYTLPYTVVGAPNYFPLQLRMCTNGTAKANAYRLTLNQPIDTSAVFVPWLRGSFTFSVPLEDKAEEMSVES